MSDAARTGEAPVLQGRGIPLPVAAASRTARPRAAPWLGGFSTSVRVPVREERRGRRIPSPAVEDPGGDEDAGAFDDGRTAWLDADPVLEAKGGLDAVPGAGERASRAGGSVAPHAIPAPAVGADIAEEPPGPAVTLPAAGRPRRGGEPDAARRTPSPAAQATDGAVGGDAVGDGGSAARRVRPAGALPDGQPGALRTPGGAATARAPGGVGGPGGPAAEDGPGRGTMGPAGTAGDARGAAYPGNSGLGTGGIDPMGGPLPVRDGEVGSGRALPGPGAGEGGRDPAAPGDPRGPAASPVRAVVPATVEPAAGRRAAGEPAVEAPAAGAGYPAAPRRPATPDLAAAATPERTGRMGRPESGRTGEPGAVDPAALLALRLERGPSRERRGGNGRRIEIGTLHVTVQPRPAPAPAASPMPPPGVAPRVAGDGRSVGSAATDPRAAFDVVFD